MPRADVANPPPSANAQRAANDPAGDVILNPRRSPRLRLCCPTRVSAGGAPWSAHTEDIGPRGCQIVSTVPVPVGGSLQIVVSATGAADLSVSGTVVWASPAPPFRLGVAFSAQHAGATSRWFDDLVRSGAAPRLEYVRGIPADATLFLRAPPRFCPDFTSDEAALIIEIGEGLRAGDLRDRFQRSWSESRHALFSLVARQLVTTSPAEAVPVARWRAFHGHLAALALETLRPVEPPAQAPVERRPAEAQALLDAAEVLMGQGRIASAIDALRGALARAPGDPEIAAALVRVALSGAPAGRGGVGSG